MRSHCSWKTSPIKKLLVQRLADEYSIDVRFNWRSAVRGHGQVVRELRDYLRDLRGQGSPLPDLIIVATIICQTVLITPLVS